jgi:hypothetical protein
VKIGLWFPIQKLTTPLLIVWIKARGKVRGRIFLCVSGAFTILGLTWVSASYFGPGKKTLVLIADLKRDQTRTDSTYLLASRTHIINVLKEQLNQINREPNHDTKSKANARNALLSDSMKSVCHVTKARRSQVLEPNSFG